MPFAYMFNAHMAYGLIRREITEAVEYDNIMETAHSILKVADGDLSNFETRFGQMARHVRQIGVETKFTAIEVAGAVKYLSMVGMNINTIFNSIRPITNLALIGDNDRRYQQYRALSPQEKNVFFRGRLGEYRYLIWIRLLNRLSCYITGSPNNLREEMC